MQRYNLKLQQQFKENYNKDFVSDIESRGAQEHAGEVLTTMLCASGTWTTGRETSCPNVHLQMEKLNILGKIQTRVKEIRGVTDFYSLNKA